MKRKLLIAVCFCLFSSILFCQSYHNEWIDYSKTYYKFKVGPFGLDIVNAPIKKGLVRIPQASLVSSGLSAIPAEYLQLWRNGEEVPLYITKTSGLLGASDYIEFWGEINDGKADKDLYTDSSFQLSDYWSLHSDSISYFFTINQASNNKRIADADNNVAKNTLPAEKNFMYTTGRYFHAFINGGYAVVDVVNLYTSTFDRGEGWTSRPVKPESCACNQSTLPQGFLQLFLDTTGASMTARIKSIGTKPNNRWVKVFLNGDSINRYQMDYFFDASVQIPNIPANRIKNDTAIFRIQNLSDFSDDEMHVATIELEYPRKFNFGNSKNFEFTVAASGKGRFLKITNFDRGSSAPVLLDLTNNKRYTADISIADTIQFLLAPSVENYHLALVRSDGTAAKIISDLSKKKFTDFSKADQQGDYLIISNPLIYGTGTSDNFVEQYRAYRNSATGGNYNAKIIDINEIADQFAYGINKHPSSIKNFLRYARTSFKQTPAYVFIIGKGVTYNAYKPNEANALSTQLNLVPTWGSPGSDNLLSSKDNFSAVPEIPIGRLSAVSSKEVEDYFSKVKEYEAAQKDTIHSVSDKSWMKNVLQIAGANDPSLGERLDSFMQKYSRIIKDTLFGGIVTSFSKTADPAGYPQAVVNFKNIYEKGSGLVEYFGHSSATNLDFSLDNPEAYDNKAKYPMFIVNGCQAGNIFDYDLNRLNLRTTISEKFILAPNRGAIGYLSTSSYGVLDYLDIFTQKFYESIAVSQYGKGFGDITKDAIAKALIITGKTDFYGRMHAEQYTLHGDPSLVFNSWSKPDYAIAATDIKIAPAYLSVADDSFAVKINIHNLGKATGDSVHFSVYRKFPNGDSAVVFTRQFASLKGADSVFFSLPIIGNRDKGDSYLTAFIDDDRKIAEVDEENNIASMMFTISDMDIRPVYPYNYSIVNSGVVNLQASTSNPLEEYREYIMETDTTAFFNSPLKITRTLSSTGGVIGFENIPLKLDNTVYYWRVAQNESSPHWTMFSFTYQSAGNEGFEQAHYFQHTQSKLESLVLDSVTRQFNFGKELSNLYVLQSIYPTSGLESSQFSISVNGTMISSSACVGSSIIFNVFDTLSFKPMENTTNPFGAAPVCDPTRKNNFEFSTKTAATRKNAMDFLDNISPGNYVVVRKVYDIGNSDWAPTVWIKDTALYGSGNSLYHRLKAQGLQIDSFNKPRTFVFVFKKNDSANFTPVSLFSQGLYDRISFSENISITDTLGYITSPKFGPAKAWNKVKWNGYSWNDNAEVNIDVLGIKQDGSESVLYSLNKQTHELNISGISAEVFPFMKLKMKNQDSISARAYQLQQWSVEYQPVAEGGIAPNIGMQIPDTVTFYNPENIAFDTLSGYVVFKNVSNKNFSPLKLAFNLIDSAGKSHAFALPLTRALPSGDTVYVSFVINLTAIPAGTYNLFLQVNPGSNQPEQYLFNNSLYKYLTIIRSDKILPVHLVSFDAKPVAPGVALKWVVTNETGFNHYEIEHSLNGKDFFVIGTVKALPGGANTKTYNFDHATPATGNNYYRLKMVDNDGKYFYSSVKIVSLDQQLQVRIYPNPFFEHLSINANKQSDKNYTVRLFNYSGQEILKKTFSLSIVLETSKLAAGNYMVQVDDGVNVQTFKVQKQK